MLHNSLKRITQHFACSRMERIRTGASITGPQIKASEHVSVLKHEEYVDEYNKLQRISGKGMILDERRQLLQRDESQRYVKKGVGCCLKWNN